MQDGAKVLSDKGITFSKGVYTTPVQIGNNDVDRSGLLLLDLKLKHPNTIYHRFTLNDTPIPSDLIEESIWNYGPRHIADYYKTMIRNIYKEGVIQKERGKLNLIKKGEKNIRNIMKAVLKQEINIPEDCSTEGVALALHQGLGASDFYQSITTKDVLIDMKKRWGKFLKPDSIDAVAAMNLKNIAENWQYRALR
jgi:hypothetical protein